jgi:hypothetical protein
MMIAANALVVLLAGIAMFQVALALGAPLGQAAWGGQHEGVLPVRLRVASAVAAAVIYPLIIVVVLAAAGRLELGWSSGTAAVAMWVLTGFFGLGALMNFASRSKAERYWGPVVLVMALCCAIIARAI